MGNMLSRIHTKQEACRGRKRDRREMREENNRRPEHGCFLVNIPT